MNPARLASLSAEWRVKREALLAAIPELATDAEALTDTLDGEAAALDVVAWLIRKSKEAEALEAGLRQYRGELGNRQTRLGVRSDLLRHEAQMLMESIGESRVQRPDFTATIGRGTRHVIVSDIASIPEPFLRYSAPEPDKIKIKEALEAGQEVPGASLSNGAAVLSVRIS